MNPTLLRSWQPPVAVVNTADYVAPPQFACVHRGRVLGRTGCLCGGGTTTTDVFECLADHGREIALTPQVNANACQLSNHQRPLSGRWPLPKLPSCSSCDHRKTSGVYPKGTTQTF